MVLWIQLEGIILELCWRQMTAEKAMHTRNYVLVPLYPHQATIFIFFHNHNQILNPFSIISLRKEQNPILCMYFFFFGVFYPPKGNNIVKYLFHQFQVIETPSAQHLISASREGCLLSLFIKFFFFSLLFAQSITAPQPKKRYRVTFKLQPMIR